MDKKFLILSLVVVALAAVVIFNLYSVIVSKRTVVENNLPERVKSIVAEQMAAEQKQLDVPPPFAAPLERASERVTKKPFGIYITPQSSPVQPEKFRGYHTGADFEIFPEEVSADVPVRAVCDGKIVQKKYASGYGGVLIESCELEGAPASPARSAESRRAGGPITVVYGHLKLASIAGRSGEALAKGEEIGILGKAGSSETNGERKHLHLGIHKGTAVNISGYVSKEADLSSWADPCSLDSVCK